MIKIREIASHIPENYEDNLLKLDQYGISESFIKEKIGVVKASRKPQTLDTSDLCIEAFSALKEKINFDINDIECVIVCTQNPDGNGIPHVSAKLHDFLGLADECACFDISLGCSGYVYGLSILKSMMISNDYKKALLFTCDPYSKIVDPNDKNTSLLFGDAATVTLLENNLNEDSLFKIGHFSLKTHGKKWQALRNDGPYLEMNGRDILGFAVDVVPQQVNEFLLNSNLDKDKVDLYLLHQGSKYIIDLLTRKMNLPDEKVPFRIMNYGNTVSSSIPLLLEEYLTDLSKKNIVLCGFGVGLSSAVGFLNRLCLEE